MRTKIILFSNQQARCVFPEALSDLPQAISELQLQKDCPVIVLIGREIDERQAILTHGAIQTITRIAEDINAVVICGGTDLGVMAEIGQIRSQNSYKFPLVGVTLEALVSWPDGPRSNNMLWWGTKRSELEPHFSHFILVPGNKFGDESPWIVAAATLLSRGQPSVTLLINGGEVSRRDIELSLENGRPVIALGGTGRLANELAMESDRNSLITSVSARDEKQMEIIVRAALSVIEKGSPTPVAVIAP